MTDLTRWFDNRLSPIEMLERLFEGGVAASGIRVEQVVEGTTLVVRADVTASYKDGVLEVRASIPERDQPSSSAHKIPIARE